MKLTHAILAAGLCTTAFAASGMSRLETAPQSTVATVSASFEKCGSRRRHTCVVDGDTIWLEGENIRLMGFDTPHPHTNLCGGQAEFLLANRASSRLVELLNQGEFTIERHDRDRYGRTLAVVRVQNENVGDVLIDEGLARRWPDGDEFWCKS